MFAIVIADLVYSVKNTIKVKKFFLNVLKTVNIKEIMHFAYLKNWIFFRDEVLDDINDIRVIESINVNTVVLEVPHHRPCHHHHGPEDQPQDHHHH